MRRSSCRTKRYSLREKKINLFGLFFAARDRSTNFGRAIGTRTAATIGSMRMNCVEYVLIIVLKIRSLWQVLLKIFISDEYKIII